MINFLYQIFIVPLESAMSFVFEGAYAATYYSEGIAIILLSITVNLVLLPIYNIFEQWQIKDRIKQKSMEEMLSMIKRSFSGQQKFIMIKTLYRQNNYNMFNSLRNSLGFFVQIPFFIAAYAFLSNNSDLAGASFFVFKDLSQPDNLFQIGDVYKSSSHSDDSN